MRSFCLNHCKINPPFRIRGEGDVGVVWEFEGDLRSFQVIGILRGIGRLRKKALAPYRKINSSRDKNKGLAITKPLKIPISRKEICNFYCCFFIVSEMRFFFSSTSFTHTVTISPTESTSDG